MEFVAADNIRCNSQLDTIEIGIAVTLGFVLQLNLYLIGVVHKLAYAALRYAFHFVRLRFVTLLRLFTSLV